MNATPIAPDLFVLHPELRLLAGRHVESGRLVFPMPANSDYEAVALPPRGTLWSYTVQRFAPKSPPYHGTQPFEPFAVGYVELKDALIVEGLLTGVAFDALRVGMPMELTTITLPGRAGGAVTTFAFRPGPVASS